VAAAIMVGRCKQGGVRPVLIKREVGPVGLENLEFGHQFMSFSHKFRTSMMTIKQAEKYHQLHILKVNIITLMIIPVFYHRTTVTRQCHFK
jgi:hypothetical protein